MREPSEDTSVHVPAANFGETFFSSLHASVDYVFGAASHVGKVRRQNEDHFAVFKWQRSTEVLMASVAAEDLDVPDACSYAMVVADGMGGMQSGELASRLALQTMVELAGRATSWVMKLTDLGAQQIQERVRAYVQRIHETLQARSESTRSLKDMGTTWTSAHLLGNDAIIAHLGDSRAYVSRDGELHQVTRDETLAQALIDQGMEPDSVRKLRHILLNSFGGGNETAHATIYQLRLQPGDQLLLCTDGLTDLMDDEEIAAELARHSTPQSACDALVNEALDRGGKDNVTVVLATAGRALPD